MPRVRSHSNPAPASTFRVPVAGGGAGSALLESDLRRIVSAAPGPALLPPTHEDSPSFSSAPPVGPAEAARWWVLATFSLASGLQGMQWITYSSFDPAVARQYMPGLTPETLITLLQEGPIMYCCLVGLAAWLLSSRDGHGLRVCVLASTWVGAVACLLRAVPSIWYTNADRAESSSPLIAWVHIGQILNAGIAPLTQVAPALLAQIWFPAQERGFATGVARTSNAAGRGVAYFLGPAIVAGKEANVTRLLLIEALMAAVLAMAVSMYFPSSPSAPPSETSRLLMAKRFLLASPRRRRRPGQQLLQDFSPESQMGHGGRARVGGTTGLFACFRSALEVVHEACTMLSSEGVLLTVTAFALNMGMYGTWSGLLPAFLDPKGSGGGGNGTMPQQGLNLTSEQAGLLGSLNTFAGIGGGLLAGAGTALVFRHHRVRTVLCVCCVLSGAAFGLAGVMVEPFLVFGVQVPYWALAVVFSVAGVVRGCIDPLIFEYAADLVFPASAGTAGGLLTIGAHIFMVVTFALPSDVLLRWTPVAMGGTMFIVAALLLCAKGTLQRVKVEQVVRGEPFLV